MSDFLYREGQLDQYGTSANLDARAALHARFSTGKIHWHDWVFDRLALPADCRILEIGCGTASLWAHNLRRVPPGWNVTLADLSSGMLDRARKRLAKDARRFRFIRAEVEALPFPDGSFHAVIANHMLYEPQDTPAAVREISRVLRRSGPLYAATNGASHMREIHRLVQAVAPGMPYATAGLIEKFNLDNGAEILGECFSTVTLQLYEGDLAVDDADAVVAYVMSLRDATSFITPDAADAVRRQVAGEIERKGVFHVTRSTGMFVAS